MECLLQNNKGAYKPLFIFLFYASSLEISISMLNLFIIFINKSIFFAYKLMFGYNKIDKECLSK